MNQEQLAYLQSMDEVDTALLWTELLDQWPIVLGKPLDPLALLEHLTAQITNAGLVVIARMVVAVIGRLETQQFLARGHLEDALTEAEQPDSDPEASSFCEGYLAGRRAMVRSIAEAMGFDDVQAKVCEPTAKGS